eukprot:754094-Hanusia_phi.AAC.1
MLLLLLLKDQLVSCCERVGFSCQTLPARPGHSPHAAGDFQCESHLARPGAPSTDPIVPESPAPDLLIKHLSTDRVHPSPNHDPHTFSCSLVTHAPRLNARPSL